MKLASWNINSLRQRAGHVIKWLDAHDPDILMLQELKAESLPDDFSPEECGYSIQSNAQKTYNGVAILSKGESELIADCLPGMEDDSQARYLEVDYLGWRLINIYAPNGNPLDSDKFTYKLAWLERLYDHLLSLRQCAVPFVIGGDFNIIPEPQDCYDPSAWAGDALFDFRARRFWRMMVNLGLYDAFRIHNKNGGQYSFWDYQGGAFQADKGIRIDHFLLSPPACDTMRYCSIDRGPRSWDKPSDHTPITLELAA
jgi:exodeoxyribonuclease-3